MESMLQSSTVFIVIAALATFFGFIGVPLWGWSVLAAATLYVAQAPIWAWSLFGAFAIVFNIPPLRRMLVTSWVLALMKKFQFIPTISETERTALKAGTVWAEAELFSGKPDFKRLMNESYPDLTAEEKKFIDGPVEELCRMCDDWKIHQNKDLPKEAWDYIKKEKFWGMLIPKEYGGLAFSALAHSEVIQKIGSRSIPACITVMVPNSLGPAELLIHYGTDEQKKYYLPRLARGEELPCFALTEPLAGSDASSISSNGVVFKAADGKLYLRLNWNKRYITLAAVSTILGLAFRLRDPENLLGKGPDVGITCALIPSKTPGITLDQRHDPLGIPFYNCPTQGKDVVVPIDAIVGGKEGAGRGWLMLMECLAAGRGISLPAQSAGGVKFLTRVASAYATVRKQFGLSIGKFEGIAEPLSSLAGWSYLMEAARKYTLGALDSGSKPPVVTAIMKYQMTELGRKAVNLGMDILGGSAISRGPRNLIANAYMAAPISITVEGANILTRTLIIFGQGALRAHPYAFKEVEAVEENNLKKFDEAFWAHIGHVVRNSFRCLILSFTRGYATIPYKGGVTAKYYRRLNWCSASFALMSDMAMGLLGGSLKTKEKLTGRYADILSWMYFATAILRRYEAEGRRKEDNPFLIWSMEYCFMQIQTAFDGIFANFDAPGFAPLFRGVVLWWSRLNSFAKSPSDSLEFKLASLIQIPGEQRNRLTYGIYAPTDLSQSFAKLENAFNLSIESEAISRKVRKAIKEKILKKAPPLELFKSAVEKNIISRQEFEIIEKSEAARNDVVQVDAFGLDEFLGVQSTRRQAPAQVSA